MITIGWGSFKQKVTVVGETTLHVVKWYDNLSVTVLSDYIGASPVTEVERRCNWNFDWNRILWSDETKKNVFSNQHSWWVWCKKENAYTKNNQYVSMVEVEVPWCCGAVFISKDLGTMLGYMASWTPWCTRKILFWIWLPLPGNYNCMSILDLVCPFNV